MLINGKAIADQIQEKIAKEISQISGRKPALAVIIVGDHPASQIYVKRKMKACSNLGIISIKKELPTTVSEKALLQVIDQFNRDPNIDGILVQLPLPPHISFSKVTSALSPEKDVDGFHPINMGKLLLDDPTGFQPCTPLGIKMMLNQLPIDITGKHAVVIGRSNIVGKPMAALLMQSSWKNPTITLVHSKSQDIPFYSSNADLLIVAIGQPKFIKAHMVKEGAIVIDVGINRIDKTAEEIGHQITGDVDFENVKNKCSYITPVPGGVGPMTIAMLLSNTLKSYIQGVSKNTFTQI